MTHKNDTLARWIGNPESYLTQDALTAGYKQINRNLRKLRKDLKLGRTHPLFTQMDSIVSEKVLSFQADFSFHDVLSLSKNPESFLWIVRDSGTWFFTQKGDWTRHTCEHVIKNERDPKFYFYNGG